MNVEDDQNRENSILSAAEHLFLEKGFSGTSTTEIAKCAGCNQALVHYYYRTKEKLFAAIFERKVKLFFSDLMKTIEPSMSLREKVERIISAHFEMLMKNPRIPFLIINEVSTNADRIKVLRNRIESTVVPHVAELLAQYEQEVAAGTVGNIDPMNLIFTMLSLNIAPFLMKPTLIEVLGKEGYDAFLDQRKNENIRIVLASLKHE